MEPEQLRLLRLRRRPGGSGATPRRRRALGPRTRPRRDLGQLQPHRDGPGGGGDRGIRGAALFGPAVESPAHSEAARALGLRAGVPDVAIRGRPDRRRSRCGGVPRAPIVAHRPPVHLGTCRGEGAPSPPARDLRCLQRRLREQPDVRPAHARGVPLPGQGSELGDRSSDFLAGSRGRRAGRSAAVHSGPEPAAARLPLALWPPDDPAAPRPSETLPAGGGDHPGGAPSPPEPGTRCRHDSRDGRRAPGRRLPIAGRDLDRGREHRLAARRRAPRGASHAAAPSLPQTPVSQTSALAGPGLPELVDEARRAPSVHNIQPARWALLGPEVLALRADPRRRLPIADPTGHDVRVSLGAAWEGMALALSRRGFSAAPPNLRVDGQGPFEARLVLERGGAPDPLAGAVARRAAYRGTFARTAAAALSALERRMEGAGVVVVRD